MWPEQHAILDSQKPLPGRQTSHSIHTETPEHPRGPPRQANASQRQCQRPCAKPHTRPMRSAPPAARQKGDWRRPARKFLPLLPGLTSARYVSRTYTNLDCTHTHDTHKHTHKPRAECGHLLGFGMNLEPGLSESGTSRRVGMPRDLGLATAPERRFSLDTIHPAIELPRGKASFVPSHSIRPDPSLLPPAGPGSLFFTPCDFHPPQPFVSPRPTAPGGIGLARCFRAGGRSISKFKLGETGIPGRIGITCRSGKGARSVVADRRNLKFWFFYQ